MSDRVTDPGYTEGWARGRWWRAIAPDGSLWGESSDEQDIRRRARPGDTVQVLWVKSEQEWRNA